MAFDFAKTYDLTYNKVVIGGVIVGGYGDDGGIEYEPSSDVVEETTGADGEKTYSRQNDRGMRVTITLKETSNSVAALDELRRQQQRPRKIQKLPYRHIDLITGDKVADSYAVFTNWAAPSKGRNAGEREYQISLPYAADGIREGLTNAVPI